MIVRGLQRTFTAFDDSDFVSTVEHVGGRSGRVTIRSGAEHVASVSDGSTLRGARAMNDAENERTGQGRVIRDRRLFGCVFQRPGRPTWTARFEKDGHRVQKSGFRTRREATTYLDRKHAEIMQGVVTGTRKIPRVTFAEFERDLFAFLGTQHGERTLVMDRLRWNGVFLPYWRDRVLCDVTRGDVESFLSTRRAGESPTAEHAKSRHHRRVSFATLNRDRAFLSVAFKHAITLGLASTNPCAGVHKAKEQVLSVPYLAPTDIARVVTHTDDSFGEFVRFQAWTGLRLGETQRLRWSDIDLGRNLLTVREAKSGHPRDVPLTSEAQAVLFDRNLRRGSAGGVDRAELVFPEVASESRKVLGAKLARASRSAGLPRIRIHDLRHHFATALARAGVPLADVGKLLGHRTIVTTLRYACHQPTNALRAAIAQLDARRVGRTDDVGGVTGSPAPTNDGSVSA